MSGFNGDTIYGAGGADLITDHGSNNVIYGDLYPDLTEHADGAGDTIYGGLYNLIDAGSGNDLVVADGSSTLIGGLGDDNLTSLTGNSSLSGGDGNDSLYGGTGNDTLDGGSGADSMAGGLGNDTYVVDNIGDVVVEAAGEGYDLVKTSVSFTLGAGVEVEEILLTGSAAINVTGNEFNNIITGNSAANVIDAGAGNDVIDTTAGGADTITGGAGSDTIVLSLGGPVTITDFQVGAGGDKLDLGTVLVGLAASGGYTFDNPFTSGFMQMVASGADTQVQVDLTGSADGAQWQTIATLQNVAPAAITADNFRYNLDPAGHTAPVTLTAGSSSAVLEGWEGNDTITGGAGNDLLDGGFGGNDSISGGDGNDTIFGYAGNDTLDGGANGDFIYGGAGNDLILGGDGDDRSGQITYKGTAYTYNNIALEGGDGNDTVDGGAGNDALSGGNGNDSLLGGTGDDYLVDISGNDTLQGGDNNDTLDDLAGGGVLFGDGGDDHLTLEGTTIASLLDGGEGNDYLSVVSSASGSVLRGGLGDDTIYASSSGLNRVAVDGGADNDFISNAGWSNSAWTIAGGEGNDRIEMGGNFHLIDAGAGNDTIDFEVAVGKTGSGTVTTGAGSDTIELSLRAVVDDQRSAVVVTDFTTGAGGDKLDLVSVIDRLGLPAGTDPFAGGYLRLVASGPNTTYVEGTLVPGVGAEYTTMAVLQGVAPDKLTADNFVQAVSPVVSANQGPVVELPHAVALQGSGATPLGITVPTDPEGGALTITLSAVPDKDVEGIVQLSNGTQVYASNTLSEAQLAGLTFTPVAGATGIGATLFYTVIDDAGNKVRTSILLDTPNTAPTVHVADQVYAVDGITPFSYDLKTVVSDTLSVDNVLSYAVSVNGGALPAWLSFDPLTHVFTGTAPVATDAAYTIALTVTDPQGLITTTSFMLTPPAVVLTGSAGDDTLTGHAGPDTLVGLAGNDLLDGGAGKDTMTGGAGNDTYVVDNAGDVVVENVGEGTDTVQASISYTLSANVENLTLTGVVAINGTGNALDNVITGNALDNVLSGADGNDTLLGGAGNDTLDGGIGTDSMTGGLGNDTYVVDNVGDVVVENAGEGSDTVMSSVNYTLGANVENLTLTGVAATSGSGNALDNVITGNALDNVLSGADGNDTLLGGAGNDTLDGGIGTDSITGGLGNDTYVVDNVGDVVVENAGEGSDTVMSSVNYTLGANVENLTLTGVAATSGSGNALDNVITGNALDNVLSGADGNDTLLGGAGNDTLSGGAGTNVLQGGTGDDTYMVDGATDVISENASEGSDTVISSVNYTLAANVENLALNESGGAISGTGNDLANVLTGNASDNVLSGGAGNDTLLGGAGNDTLDGGSGADSMVGGLGNDTYRIDNSGDVVVESTNAGTDTVIAAVTYAMGANIENLTLDAASGAISGYGNALDNVVTGNASDNSVFGGDGNDTLSGGAGNDFMVGGMGADSMIGGTGNDTFGVDNVGDVVVENANEGTDTVISAITYTLGANVENLTLHASGGAINGSGNALVNIITGNASDNVIDGGAAGDLLNGGAGNDTLIGGVGADTMLGGVGNDTYYVDSIGDVVTENANEGVDTVVSAVTYVLGANVENLTLDAASGAINGYGNVLGNLMVGNASDNSLLGDAGSDTLIGGAGNDFLVGGTGADSMLGGAGNDTYGVDSIGDIVVENAGEGIDTVISAVTFVLGANVENLTLHASGGAINGYGNAVDNVITGNASDNSIFGDLGNDTLSGGAGNDFIIGGAGADSMLGGLGNDTFGVDNVGDVVVENANEGTDTVISAISYTLGANLENLTLHASGGAINGTGNALGNLLTGNDSDNTLSGGAGVDTLIGGAGNDLLDGGTGADTMLGGVGNDTYYVDSIGDVVTENANEGVDTVVSAVTYVLGANVENLTLDAASGAINGYGNVLGNLMVGNASDNSLLGDAGSDTLIGGAGNDFLVGGTGADSMLGGAGNDTYGVDSIGDIVVENAGEGIDTVISAVTFVLGANVENLTLHASGGAINGYGNAVDNVITGNASDNSIFGDLGNDTLSGGAGNDFIIGGAGADSMLGGLGNDTFGVDNVGDVVVENANEGTDTVISAISYTLGANLENLTLHASGGAINGTGNALGNVILGNAFNNVLAGGAGNDTLTGGLGSDHFVFNTALNATTNVDTISDYAVGVDHIDLAVAMFGGAGAIGALLAASFYSGAGLSGSTSAAQGAGIYYDTSTGSLYYDADGNGGVAAVKFASVTGHPALSAADFNVIA
ncbi:MAG: putative Ig domain-containing protein [Leptothrix sp. (in: b-proteobacteria)]